MTPRPGDDERGEPGIGAEPEPPRWRVPVVLGLFGSPEAWVEADTPGGAGDWDVRLWRRL